MYRIEIRNKHGGEGHIDVSDSTVDAALNSAARCLALRSIGGVKVSAVADLYYLKTDGGVLFASDGGGDSLPLVREHERRAKVCRDTLNEFRQRDIDECGATHGRI